MSRKTITLKYGIQMKEPRRIPPWLKVLSVIIIVGVAVYGSYSFVTWIFTPSEEEQITIEVTPYVYITAEPTPEPTATPRPSPTINPNTLYELMTVYNSNSYSTAWVTIPGIGLNSVIMQYTDNTFYLDHDINQLESTTGAMFLDYRSDISYIQDAGHIVIYGYGDTNGRQLRSLFRYKKEDYFNRNTLIVIDTLYGTFNFRLFSVHIMSDDRYYTAPIDEDNREQFIADCIENSMYVSDNIPEDDSVILTFSCDIEGEVGDRFLVHAYLEQED